jgi:DNA polymerase III delta prime subunit
MEQFQIFISYAREDAQAASQLAEWLRRAGYITWVDRENLLPGERWDWAITKALRESAAVIICWSSHSISKRGFLQKEIKIALERADEKLTDDLYILPVRLDECPMPDGLSRFQWVDLFGENTLEARDKLLRALEEAAKRMGLRKAAQKTLFSEIGRALQNINDLQGMAQARDILKMLPSDVGYSPETQRRISEIAGMAQDYQTRLTPIGKLKVLEELRDELAAFQNAMTLISSPDEVSWQSVAQRWLSIVVSAEQEVRGRLSFLPLPNPYVAGAPLQTRDFGLLKGRRDIIRAIEKDILIANQRPSLLLYGRRRTGKSSTLLNLPRLLSSQFEPVYIDCQDARWRESDQAFCYNLARDVFDRLHQSEAIKDTGEPRLEQFEKNAFTRLDQYLDQFEQFAAQRGKRILLSFDEYEGLEEGIAGGDISKNVLGKLRNIIQHRERIVVLVSGSHRFEELSGVNWASYLINTRTLELSFLDEASARELLTEPVPQLRYEDGVLDEILRLTHCQPYLLQAVASELVNHLNERQQTMAARDDLDAAVEKTLTSAGAYFANTWREDNSEAEQTVLRAFATDEGSRVLTAEYQATLQSLRRKEMLERDADGYRLAVPLLGRWIVKNQVAEALPEPLVRVA